MRIYLDHAATTPLHPVALEAMRPWLGGVAANPSSVHRSGQRARAAVETAREQVAAAVNAAPGEIVFTSGATEADALGLVGTLHARPSGTGLIVSRTEHAAVLQVAALEEERGRPTRWLPPARGAAPDPASLDAALRAAETPVGIVAVMHTNNETGDVADVPALAALAHDAGAAFLCDAVQAFGYEPLDVRSLGADLVALSSHKIGGPQGVGALWIRDGHEIEPLALGGAQERGRRAGTHAVAAIVGFGAAAAEASRSLAHRAGTASARRDRLEAALLRIPGVHRNGGSVRGPKHANVRVAGVDGESLLMALDATGVEASAGSACAAGSVEPSHVLTAMGLRPEEARASLRFSTAASVTGEEIDVAAARVEETVLRLRELGAPALGPL